MTKLLDRAIETVRELPSAVQDEIAHAMLNLARTDEVLEDVDPAHLADVLESLAQAKRREFASDAEIEAAFRGFTDCSCGSRPAPRKTSNPSPFTFGATIPQPRSASERPF